MHTNSHPKHGSSKRYLKRNHEGELVEPIPAVSWLGSLSPLLVVPCLAISAIAFAAPANILDLWPSLKSFTDFMVKHIPYMAGHSDSTKFPQVALLVNCLVVACTAWIGIVVFTQAHLNYSRLLARRRFLGRLRFQDHFVVFFGMFVMLGAMAVMVLVGGEVSWIKGAMTERRGLFFIFTAGVMPYVTGFVLGGQVLNFRLFVDTYQDKELHHE